MLICDGKYGLFQISQLDVFGLDVELQTAAGC